MFPLLVCLCLGRKISGLTIRLVKMEILCRVSLLVGVNRFLPLACQDLPESCS